MNFHMTVDAVSKWFLFTYKSVDIDYLNKLSEYKKIV